MTPVVRLLFTLSGVFALLSLEVCESARVARDTEELVIWGVVEEDEGGKEDAPIDTRFGEGEDLNTTVVELFNNCVCVWYYQCDEDNFIITDGQGLLAVRAGAGVERIPCPQKDYVCCRNRDNTSAEPSEGPPESRNPRPGQGQGQDDPWRPDGGTSERPELSTIRNGRGNYRCGQQRPVFNERIFVDDDEYAATLEGEFPWMAAIYKRDSDSSSGYKFKCGGSLIHEKVVLTATHCIKGIEKDDLRVMVNGMNELHDIGVEEKFERDVHQVITHPKYYGGGAYNDVALLILREEYNISSGLINTVCLPNGTKAYDGDKCIVAGWGQSKSGGSKELRKVQVPLVESDRCQQLLRETRLGKFFILHESFICAGGEEGKDACRGDGGGPLVCPVNNGDHYVQVGIVSWGIECAMKDVPGVYASLPALHDWIWEELAKLDIY